MMEPYKVDRRISPFVNARFHLVPAIARTHDYKPVMIFSSHLSVLQVLRWGAHNGVPLRVLLGSYKGAEEVSYLVHADNIKDVVDSDILDEQEAVIFAVPRAKDEGLLTYMVTEKTVQRLGVMDAYDLRGEHPLRSGGDFTYDPVRETFYVIKEKDESHAVPFTLFYRIVHESAMHGA